MRRRGFLKALGAAVAVPALPPPAAPAVAVRTDDEVADELWVEEQLANPVVSGYVVQEALRRAGLLRPEFIVAKTERGT